MAIRFSSLVVAALLVGAAPPPATVRGGAVAAPVGLAVATPADIYGPLYRAVQIGRLFPDGKSFADAVPLRDPGAILADYRRRPPVGRDALRRFVTANFMVPATAPAPRPAPGPRPPLATAIAATWAQLVRAPAPVPPGGSALPLARPYVVPGGRFRELYYWDSYFTMLGLARDGRRDLVEAMIDDFTGLIERYGHIPNGTRSYYLSRSQPPAFYLMLGLSRASDPALFRRRLAALRREHGYWMLGEATLRPASAAFHAVRMPDGTILNRYWDTRDTPRDESYAEDVATARATGRAAPIVWRELRAGAESGWDYSSRWLADGRTLGTIRVTRIAPVDLNSLLYGQEQMIAAACDLIDDAACTREYRARASARAAAMRRWMWDARGGRYADVEWQTGRRLSSPSAAALFPLFTGVATRGEAVATAAMVRRRLLARGGLRTTAARTGQQWDAPNGWAPLQWIAVAGLRRYGDQALARTIATRWVATVDAHYRRTGALVEKYDIEHGREGRGGEYATQIGFGWTNGVTKALMEDYP